MVEKIPLKVIKKLKKPVWVVIAFGCNVGDCQKQIALALELVKREIHLKRVSPIYKSKPYGVENQPDFLNGVFFGYTHLKPFDLLRFLKWVEKKVGRKPRCRWCEREIDLDVVYYGTLEVHFEELKIPHPDRVNRDFVLKPLDWITPNFEDPLLGLSPKGLIRKFLKV